MTFINKAIVGLLLAAVSSAPCFAAGEEKVDAAEMKRYSQVLHDFFAQQPWTWGASSSDGKMEYFLQISGSAIENVMVYDRSIGSRKSNFMNLSVADCTGKAGVYTLGDRNGEMRDGTWSQSGTTIIDKLATLSCKHRKEVEEKWRAHARANGFSTFHPK